MRLRLLQPAGSGIGVVSVAVKERQVGEHHKHGRTDTYTDTGTDTGTDTDTDTHLVNVVCHVLENDCLNVTLRHVSITTACATAAAAVRLFYMQWLLAHICLFVESDDHQSVVGGTK